VVLDFAMSGRDTRAHDIAKVYFQLELLTVKPQFRARVIERLQRALLSGFNAHLQPTHPLFRLAMLQHRINHLTSVSMSGTAGVKGLYDAAVRRLHQRRLARELNCPIMQDSLHS
jgi:hypothetical protein